MTRAQTLIVTTALAAVLPLASAMAQTGGNPATKCGAETWSTDKMMYVDVPCVGAEASQQGTVGTSGPAVAQAPAGNCGPETWSTDKMAYVGVPCNGSETATVGSSSSMTKAEMKQGMPYAYPQPGSPMPMQSQAMTSGAPMMADQSCGASNAVAMKDEYGHKYNCRGDRIR